jgi:FMN-dependent NADH-azoreductase
MKLLHLDSSILAGASVSRSLTSSVVEEWTSRVPGLEVTYRDLASDPLSHLSGSLLAGRSVPPEERTLEQQRDIEASDAALEEFLAADVVVVGAPMYNFTIPSQLKAWIDRIAVAGRTFKYGPSGPQGLAGGKKVVIISSRGGLYGPGTPAESLDFQERYLRAVFNFLGVTDIEVVRAEGVSMSPIHRKNAIDSANRTIRLAA